MIYRRCQHIMRLKANFDIIFEAFHVTNTTRVQLPFHTSQAIPKPALNLLPTRFANVARHELPNHTTLTYGPARKFY